MAATNETEKLLSPKRRSRGAKRQKEEGGISGKDIAMFGAEMLPGVSQAIGVKRTSDALKEKDYVGAGIEGTALAASLFPGIGPAAAKGLRTFNKTRKAYKLFVKGEDGELYPLFVNADKPIKQGEFLEADFPDVAFKGKRTSKSDEKNYVPTKGAKRAKGEKTKNTGDPVIIPDEATRQKLIDNGFITERTKRTKEAPFGKVTAVAARPGFHASQSPVATHLGPQDIKVSKAEAKKLVDAGITPEAIKRRGNQFYVKRRAEDQVFAEVDMADDVDYQSMLAKEGKSDINDYVPKGGSYKYSDGQADSDQWVVGGDMRVNRVLSREETRAIQKEMGVVDLPYKDEVASILGRKLMEGGLVMDDYIIGKQMSGPARKKLAEGGMSKQMDMFQDGGLEQHGGTIDPISGNDVPPGSAQEEVRDDIPAQLSEGEFVFPADVVRYIGLEKLMRLRQEAKMGLKMMEEMGQMGNADEATMPDDLPFDINDLDMDDEIGDNNEIEMQVGGMVPSIPPGIPTPQQQVFGISGFQQAAAPTTGVAAIPEAASQQFVQPVARPAQAAVPTMKQFDQQEIPSFADFTGGDFGGYDELRQYRNEAGNVINVPFRNGQPISPIPEGYTFVDPEATQTEDVTTTSTTPQTTSVRMEDADSQSRDEARRKEEERKFGPGSGRLSIGEDTFGVSFDMPDGFIPGAMGALGTSFGLLTGKPLPAGVNVNFKFEDDEFTLTSGEYNRLKKSIQETGSKSAQTKNLFKDLKQQDQRRKDAVAAREAIRFGEIDGRIVSREEERKDTEEKAAKFTDAMKENNLVFDKTTGAIVMKDGTSAQKQKDFMDYVASMATDDDEDDAADDRQFKEQQRQDSAGLPQAEISSAGAASNRGGSRGGTQSGATGGGYGGGFSDRGRFAAKGGLMEAPKPKAKKKMKRGGLASKK